mmetsp:Transcript_33097/g.77217  ORF Transcript_33097/g.77217 Transcript_33097/m.77217 type:complete len:200 (-) Transcript_33097:434-1033(-)
MPRENHLPSFAISETSSGQDRVQSLSHRVIGARKAFMHLAQVSDLSRYGRNVGENVPEVAGATEGDDDSLAGEEAPDPALGVSAARFKIGQLLVVRKRRATSSPFIHHSLLEHPPSPLAHRHELHPLCQSDHGLLLRPLHSHVRLLPQGRAAFFGACCLPDVFALLHRTRKVTLHQLVEPRNLPSSRHDARTHCSKEVS